MVPISVSPGSARPSEEGAWRAFVLVDGTGGTPRVSACDGKERATSHHIPSRSDLNDPRARHLRTYPPQNHGERVLDGDRKGGAALPRRHSRHYTPTQAPPYYRRSEKARDLETTAGVASRMIR